MQAGMLLTECMVKTMEVLVIESWNSIGYNLHEPSSLLAYLQSNKNRASSSALWVGSS